ncbi:MAG TPA: glycoside hydrolase family 2 protein [Bacteroidales bacterium]|nr:glycoside hydrolase family 2 protein [Bacteroidales bacterium]
MKRRILITGLILIQCLTASSQKSRIEWPEITRENKPWSRWWWPGSIVNPGDITTNLEKYKAAGLGGMEVTAIYGVKGHEDKFINYLSPKWMEMFTHVLKEAERLDMGIDLANASGWPFGGPWVNPEDACRNINYKTYRLSGGKKLTEKIEFRQIPLVRPVGQKPDMSKLIDPISKNKNLQLYAIDQIRFDKPLPLYALMAYSDSGEVLNLTPLVTRERDLEWTAPDGDWTLYALFQGWHGKLAERAGPGGEGDVIDHFSGKAIDNFLKHFDTVFMNYDLKSLRGYFNDSYEVDDASGQADWTTDLFNEFYIRRGYHLGEHLPALFRKDDSEKNARVLSDYRQTISDLILDKFTTHWTQWANKQGKITRNQAHGSPGNILDLYSASDIPETEGSEITKLKFASSAANVTGKKYSSCEAATWLNEHFVSTLSDIKKAADIFFLGGINHLLYHGTCYSPPDEPWPGFLFYAAVELTPVNPLWNDFKALNKYVTRVQSFMQQGRPDNDILLYFPIFDRFADYGRGMLEHFDAISPAYNGTPFKTGAELMIREGYAWDYISDLQLTNTEIYEGLLQTEGNIYKTLVLPGCKYIPLETFSRIMKLANDGASVIIYGTMPENISGWADLEEKNYAFMKLKDKLDFRETGSDGIRKAGLGKGSFVTGNDLRKLLEFSGIRRESMADNGLRFTRRETDKAFNYFILNQSEKAFDGWLPVNINSHSLAIFDPITDQYGLAKVRMNRDGTPQIYTRLYPGESLIVSAYKNPVKGKQYMFYDPLSTPHEITGTWKTDFISGGPVLPSPAEIRRLKSWTDFGNDDLKNFSGTASYKISFAPPSSRADAWMLNLGKVAESATVILNGKEIASLMGPDFRVIIPKKQIKKNNILEIRVSNLMANRIAYMDRNDIEWKRFYNINMAARMRQNTKNGLFDASSWPPMKSGLLGPVTITPVRKDR